MNYINWNDFQKVDIRAGTITKVVNFPEAIKPAYKIWVDLGNELGIKKSSAQLTDLYKPEQLIGKQVICVVNFPDKQIGPFTSEILITGFPNEQKQVVLASIEQSVPNGARLF